MIFTELLVMYWIHLQGVSPYIGLTVILILKTICIDIVIATHMVKL